MSKLSFRARALDAAKPLPVYRNGDLPDLTDCCVAISRAVPAMPTGMEKEEETEHHLQRAMCAQQVYREKKESMVIPVPETEGNVTYYNVLYRGEFPQPKQLIHIQPLGLDSEQPDYDMDSEDETLLNRLSRKMELKPLQFEIMVDRLEKASTNQLVTLQEAKLLLNEDDYLLKSVYDYWVRKRKNCGGPSLIPQIKQEKRDGSTNNDAYVAFRRRTEKMQTRKNRKNDEASYEKMLKLRRDFSRTLTILEMIKKREKSKRELLHLTLEVVEKRFQLGDYTGEILNEASAPLSEKTLHPPALCVPPANRHKSDTKIKCHKVAPKHHPLHFPIKSEPHLDFTRPQKRYHRRPKPDPLHPPSRPERPLAYTPSVHANSHANVHDIKQYDFRSSGEDDVSLSASSEPDEENDPDGVFVFRRRNGCHYLAPLTDQTHTSASGLGSDEPWHCNALTALSVPHRCIAARRRVGRGGRVLLDRASSGLDRALRHLDPDMFGPSHEPAHTPRNIPPSARSLSQLLSNIRTCRWRCFRPRPLHPHPTEDSSRRGGAEEEEVERKENGVLTALSSRSGVSGGITEEQFQTHQQQLAQMQQQQLAQFQQQKNTTIPELLLSHTPKAVSSDSLSKTLDSASAQFAASAVISANNKHHGPAVNGVLTHLAVSRQTKLARLTPGGGGGVSDGPPTRPSSVLSKPPLAVPRSLPHGHGPLSSVSAVSPAHKYPHVARPCAPSPPALKLASVASSLDRVPKVAPASAVDSIGREKHETERLTLNGLSDTTVAMEVT